MKAKPEEERSSMTVLLYVISWWSIMIEVRTTPLV